MTYWNPAPRAYGSAEQDSEDTRSPREKQRRTIGFTAAGERIPPVHKPYNRRGCEWVNGIGWVWNPTRRRFVA